MIRLAVFVAAVAVFAAPAAAQGFNPFGDTMVNRYSWQSQGARPAPGRPSTAQPQTAKPKPAPTGALSFFGSDDDDAPPPPQSRQASRPPVPALLEGGPRPSISGSTPPLVAFKSNYGAGNIVIDSGGRALYYVVSSTKAYRYPVAVGREGFSWTGVEKVSRKTEWPDWRPPAEMRQRQPNLPEVMTGGINNPLGARAIYLGSTLYRIHGTNDSRSIGSASSSGCFRMTNANVVDLYGRVSSGATVHVVSRLPGNVAGGAIEGEGDEAAPVAPPKKRRRASL